MDLFYRPKHMKPSNSYTSLINAYNFVIGETVWYAEWWVGALRQVANKFYQFGELMQKGGVWVIEKIDRYLEQATSGELGLTANQNVPVWVQASNACYSAIVNLNGVKRRNKSMAIVKLSAPWQTYYKELSLLFEHDDEVRIIYDTDAQMINIFVDNAVKAEVMTTVLPAVKQFGSVELKINIIPSNKVNMLKASKGMGFVDLFKGNPIVDDVVVVDGIMTNPITYVIFKKEIVQYFNDDLGDAHGICSTLYQDIAARVFEPKKDVHFCTDTKISSYQIPSDYCITTSGIGF